MSKTREQTAQHSPGRHTSSRPWLAGLESTFACSRGRVGGRLVRTRRGFEPLPSGWESGSSARKNKLNDSRKESNSQTYLQCDEVFELIDPCLFVGIFSQVSFRKKCLNKQQMEEIIKDSVRKPSDASLETMAVAQFAVKFYTRKNMHLAPI